MAIWNHPKDVEADVVEVQAGSSIFLELRYKHIVGNRNWITSKVSSLSSLQLLVDSTLQPSQFFAQKEKTGFTSEVEPVMVII
jgi:hypothetical protein